MEYINLVLSKFKLDIEDDHRRFVRSLTEGVDKVFTELKGKVEYEDILRLVKEKQLVVISGAPGTGKAPWPRSSARMHPGTWNHSVTSWW